MRKTDALKVYEHYGVEKDREAVRNGEYKSVDFRIGKEENLAELTGNMVGFGCDESQTVVIEYDKGYGFFLVKCIRKNGACKEAPGEN